MKLPDLIIFDADEILFDHLGALGEFVQKHYGIIPKTQYPLDYGLTEWLGVSQHKAIQILKHFNEKSYEFGLLKPLDPYAPGLLNAIKHSIPGVKLAVLTKSGTKGHGEVLRRVNVENVYPGAFDEVHIIEMDESKSAVMTELKTRYNVICLVDDYIQNIDDALALGISGIMLKRPHNLIYRPCGGFTYVDTWPQIVHTIISLYNKNEK